MRCWMSVYDGGLYLAHAETAGKAKRQLAADLGCDFVEVDMRRCPAMDDLPENDANLIRTGLAAYVFCHTCDRTIHPYLYGERDQGIGLEAYDDNDDTVLDPVISWNGWVYCSQGCLPASVPEAEQEE